MKTFRLGAFWLLAAVLTAVAATVLVPYFSPIERIAPPPLGTFKLGSAGALLSSFGWLFDAKSFAVQSIDDDDDFAGTGAGFIAMC